ncbi:hypothetical protein [Leptospira alstonii]|uniref:Uncharacterized protein n=2 Tax=Leptospira alstonii TaxID=28452 RepID=M6CUJ2_9LEPT|nr:hypothetical protein [Leptospira alstonii]EMJ94171.1 hypothetical protein LEP1GSC194_0208 [Leptospira alstonii serovar Sichuan str. 79601]EQA79287.1 hypothetical protein LEP1GSC193_2654 [Leptospira alstonii serovar Pingchang str. 80-412]
MSFLKTVRREAEVAFSKNAQALWFRIFKYVMLVCILYFFWGSRFLGPILLFILAASLSLHLWFRYKTSGWTKSYGLWDYDKNKSALDSDDDVDSKPQNGN